MRLTSFHHRLFSSAAAAGPSAAQEGGTSSLSAVTSSALPSSSKQTGGAAGPHRRRGFRAALQFAVVVGFLCAFYWALYSQFNAIYPSQPKPLADQVVARTSRGPAEKAEGNALFQNDRGSKRSGLDLDLDLQGNSMAVPNGMGLGLGGGERKGDDGTSALAGVQEEEKDDDEAFDDVVKDLDKLFSELETEQANEGGSKGSDMNKRSDDELKVAEKDADVTKDDEPNVGGEKLAEDEDEVGSVEKSKIDTKEDPKDDSRLVGLPEAKPEEIASVGLEEESALPVPTSNATDNTNGEEAATPAQKGAVKSPPSLEVGHVDILANGSSKSENEASPSAGSDTDKTDRAASSINLELENELIDIQETDKEVEEYSQEEQDSRSGVATVGVEVVDETTEEEDEEDESDAVDAEEDSQSDEVEEEEEEEGESASKPSKGARCYSRSLRSKSRCLKYDYCYWRSKSKTLGNFCISQTLAKDCSIYTTKTSCRKRINCYLNTKSGLCEHREVILEEKESTALAPTDGDNSSSTETSFDSFLLPSGELESTKWASTVFPAKKPEAQYTKPQPYEWKRTTELGCDLHDECLESSTLAKSLGDFTWKDLGNYDMAKCCSNHPHLKIMVQALADFFERVSFEQYFLDETTLQGAVRYSGKLKPWSNIATVGVVVDTKKLPKPKSKRSKSKKSIIPAMHVSRRKYVSTMMSFNKAMHYRPYVLRVCTSTQPTDSSASESSDVGKTRCVFSSKLPSSKKRIDYFVISHMDHDQSGPMLKVTPYLPTPGACIKEDRVPIEWVTPSALCQFKFYGMPIRCPRYPLRYLDLTQPSWRMQKSPRGTCKGDACSYAESAERVHALCAKTKASGETPSTVTVDSSPSEGLPKNKTKSKTRRKRKAKAISESV